MGFRSPKKSLLEERIRQLEKEASLVRSDMRALSKVITRPEEAGGLPRLKSRERPAPVKPASRPDPVASARAARAAETLTPHAEPGGIFDWHLRKEGRDRAAAAPAAPPAPPETAPAVRRHRVEGDERFASYFASGGFLGAKPMKQEKNFQRNRALFMIVVVIIFGFIVWKLAF